MAEGSIRAGRGSLPVLHLPAVREGVVGAGPEEGGERSDGV